MNQTKKILILAAVISLSSTSLVYAMASSKEWVTANYNACMQLKPGVYLKDLIQVMGEPTQISENTASFQSGIMGSTIHAMIEPSTGQVLKLHCSKERPIGNGKSAEKSRTIPFG